MARDFGDPLELFREALHNAYDWGAKEFKIIIIFSQGTHIRIEGYNNNQRSTLKRDILKDYLYWYTISPLYKFLRKKYRTGLSVV